MEWGCFSQTSAKNVFRFSHFSPMETLFVRSLDVFFRCLLVYTSKVFVCDYVYMYEWVCAFRLSEYCRRKFTIFSLWFERLSCLVPMLIFHVQFSSCIRRQGSQREFHHQFLYLFAYISIRLFVITSILTGKNCGQLRKKWRPEEIGREKIPTFWIFNFDNIRG